MCAAVISEVGRSAPLPWTSVLLRGCPLGIFFFVFVGLRVYVGQFGRLGSLFVMVSSSNQLHGELSLIKSSINQVSVPQNVDDFAVSWPSVANPVPDGPQKEIPAKGQPQSLSSNQDHCASIMVKRCLDVMLYDTPPLCSDSYYQVPSVHSAMEKCFHSTI